MPEKYNDKVNKEDQEWDSIKNTLTDEEKTEYLKKKKRRSKIVHKSVQVWIDDIIYHQYVDNLEEADDNYKYEIIFPVMLKLARRLELAGKVNLTDKYSSTLFQTTNYGLGGTCAIHTDPAGYIEGVEIPDHDPSFKRLVKQGDMIATFMGWLNDVPAGGATAFVRPYFEQLVWPTRGAVAFWWDLDKKGYRDYRTQHGGCPIVKGSKWILNKWVYYFDQFKNYPCALDTEKRQDPFSNHY